MKSSLCVCLFLFMGTLLNAQTRRDDSLALIAFEAWCTQLSWDKTRPLDQWLGVEVNADGRVVKLDLSGHPSFCRRLRLEDLSELEEVDLSNSNLQGEIPDFFSLPKLRVLNLSGNYFKGNVPNFSSLPNLEELNLSNCWLVGALPELDQLPNLVQLDLSDNKFHGPLSTSLKLPSLTRLDISQNNLDGPLPSFEYLPNLQHLDLAQNKFSGILPIPSSLSNIVSLDLSQNNLEGNIPMSYVQLPAIELLLLSDNQFYGAVPDVSLSQQLKQLDVSENNLSAVTPFSQSGLRVPSHFSINVSDNLLTFEDLLPLRHDLAVAYPSSQLQCRSMKTVGHERTMYKARQQRLVVDSRIDEQVEGNLYTWYRNGVFLVRVRGTNRYNDPSLFPSIGTYSCTISNDQFLNFEIRVADIHVQTVEGIQRDDLPFRLTPNPASDWLYVYDIQLEASFTARVFNELGQEVWRRTYSSALQIEVPVSHLPSGVYVLQLYDEAPKGGLRFVKQ